MPVKLEGSCRCGAVTFSCQSHTPQPYQRCYCTICRKTAGGGGYAINLGADARTMKVKDSKKALRVYRAEIEQADGTCEQSTAERNFCSLCGTSLWLFSPEWPELIHPLASAIDSPLPTPPSSVHLLLADKADWVVPNIRKGDHKFQGYPKESIEDWHRSRGLWVD